MGVVGVGSAVDGGGGSVAPDGGGGSVAPDGGKGSVAPDGVEGQWLLTDEEGHHPQNHKHLRNRLAGKKENLM